MTTTLLDANVMIARSYEGHAHYVDASAWLGALNGKFATCAVTQGALIRFLIRTGATPAEAIEILGSLTGHANHEFWAEGFPFTLAMLRGVVGYRQVTDAYLAEAARARGARIATFDLGLAALHPDVVELIPT